MESERFGRAARGPLDAPVPSCPEWTLGDLVWHLAGVQFFWEQVVRTRATDRAGIQEPLDRPDDELPPWFDEVSAGLVRALEDVEASARVWSWAGGEQDVAWVARRQAHEAAVHRWDAQRAIGEPTPIAPDLAADGIDEFFEWMIGPKDVATLEGSVAVRLSSPDAGRVWTWARPLDRITGRA
ncbi:MAG: maleylpyruvate isomerase family mycothiol-dependent enzyme, partial [Actinomycetota bacterium]